MTTVSVHALSSAIQSLVVGQHLTIEAAESAFAAILSGECPEVAIAAFLTAMRAKGETADELAGGVKAIRDRMACEGLVVPSRGVLDTCGTGGDGAKSVNVSTAAAIVVAAAGVPVAKHGNRSASGNSGSSEVLEELGVKVEADARIVSRALEELGITFLFASKYHPGLRHVGPVRRKLPFRTVFNLVGPLANPARPDFQLIGAAGRESAVLMAHALCRLGIRRAAVVTGSDGTDEVSLTGPTHVLIVENQGVAEQTWTPDDFGMDRTTLESLRVSGPAESAAHIRDVLAGKRGPIRDTIVANAAAGLWVAGETTMTAAVRRAEASVDSGEAARLLGRWAKLSHLPD